MIIMLLENFLANLNVLELCIGVGLWLSLRNQIKKIKCELYHGMIKDCVDYEN